jgi:hypothetical protein
MDVKATRQAIADAAKTVASPRQLVATAYAPGAIDPPFAYPSDTDGNYHDTTDDTSGMVVTLRILTSRAEDRSGQELLDDYLASEGPTSVPAAIEAAVSTATVTGFSGYRMYEHASTDYYGAELTVVILA